MNFGQRLFWLNFFKINGDRRRLIECVTTLTTMGAAERCHGDTFASTPGAIKALLRFSLY